MTSPVKIIINRGSGDDNNAEETESELIELFAANNLTAEVFIADDGEKIFELTEKALESDAEIIVAGGGDGTISAVASKLLDTKKSLGILPLGTLNHFSKDLNIPQEIEEAVRVIAEGNTLKIDVGELNGQIFINNSSIGLYPSIVKYREHQQKQKKRGKWSAAFWALMKILRRHPFLSVRIEAENERRVVKTPFVFVGNNDYEMDFLKVGKRERLDGGKLGVYFLSKSGRRGLVALILRLVFGRLRQAKDFEAIDVCEITIETDKKQILVARDGEVDTMTPPLRYRIRPLALRVIAPQAEPEESNK